MKEELINPLAVAPKDNDDGAFIDSIKISEYNRANYHIQDDDDLYAHIHFTDGEYIIAPYTQKRIQLINFVNLVALANEQNIGWSLRYGTSNRKEDDECFCAGDEYKKANITDERLALGYCRGLVGHYLAPLGLVFDEPLWVPRILLYDDDYAKRKKSKEQRAAIAADKKNGVIWEKPVSCAQLERELLADNYQRIYTSDYRLGNACKKLKTHYTVTLPDDIYWKSNVKPFTGKTVDVVQLRYIDDSQGYCRSEYFIKEINK